MNENYKFAKFIRINNKYKAYNDEKEIIKLYEKEVNNLQSKIDMAIEYIKIQQKVFKDYDIVIKNQLNNLLDILK